MATEECIRDGERASSLRTGWGAVSIDNLSSRLLCRYYESIHDIRAARQRTSCSCRTHYYSSLFRFSCPSNCLLTLSA